MTIPPFSLPELPYSYSALEPAISAQIMRLHHLKHHKTYVEKLNAGLKKYPQYASWPLEKLLEYAAELPVAFRTTVINNGGGHYNHSLFWQCMAPEESPGINKPSGTLYELLQKKYGSFDNFVEKFTTEAFNLFGSGWVWLMPNLEIVVTKNQDSPLTNTKTQPILGLDVWEHAYYLDYYNDRAKYISAWWRVVNWQFVQDRLEGYS